MTELMLTRDERLALRGRAHHLNPVVLLGAAGLTDAVLKETDRALAAHELIKVRVPGDDREAREAIAVQITEQLGAARVQVIGKLLVLYRPRPAEDGEPRTAPASGKAPGKRPAARPVAPGPARGRAGAGGPPIQRATPRRGGGRGR